MHHKISPHIFAAHNKKRAVRAPTSEQLYNLEFFRARCTDFCAISYKAKKRAVRAPTSEQLYNLKFLRARCTNFCAISYRVKRKNPKIKLPDSFPRS